MGGRTEVALTEGEAVAAGGELTSPTGVAAGVSERFAVGAAITTLAVAASAPEESPEELHATASNSTSSAVNNAAALNTCQTGPVRKSVVNGNLLCTGGGTIGRYQSAYRCVASSTSGNLTQNTSARVVPKTWHPSDKERGNDLFVDLHTHIDQYEPDELPGMFDRARAVAVGPIIAAGVTVESTRRCLQLAAEYENVFAGVGVHPSDLTEDLDNFALDQLRNMASDERVIVMSEVGLDHQDDSPDRAVQERAFRAQLDIAHEASLPVVFHMRFATDDMIRVLTEERISELGGAAHYFQGSHEEASAVIDLGCYISLAKPLLRLPELQEVAQNLPLEWIVLETDCYPQPFKGKREKWTEPKDVPIVAAKLAELKGIDVAEVMEATTANVLTMLGPRADRVSAAL